MKEFTTQEMVEMVKDNDHLRKLTMLWEENHLIHQMAQEILRLRTGNEHLEATLNAVIEAAGEDWQDVDNLPNVVKAMADIVQHRQAAPASQQQQLLEQMIADLQKLANPQNQTIPPMSPEMFRQQAVLAAMNGMLASGSVKFADVTKYAVKHADALEQELAK